MEKEFVMKVSPGLKMLKPYEPGKPEKETMREYGLEKVYKLASNENPLGPSPKVVEALSAALKEIHRYPDGSCFELRGAMAKYYDVPQENLAFGSGSNELIDLLIRIYCEPGDTVLTSQAAFIAYKLSSVTSRANLEEVPLDSELRFNLPEFLKRINDSSKPAPKLVFIANPNNPTGTYVNGKDLQEFLFAVRNREDMLVVLDEAYCEYVRATDFRDGLEFFEDCKNLVVLRTVSKVFGMAGLRLGTIIAQPEVISFIHRVRMPFNVNSLAQVAGMAAVNDKEYLEKSRKVNWDGLDYFYKEFDSMGLKYWPSQANFVLVDVGRDARKVFEQLLAKGVILRPIGGYGFPNYLRVSVGLPEENEIAIRTLKEVLG